MNLNVLLNKMTEDMEIYLSKVYSTMGLEGVRMSLDRGFNSISHLSTPHLTPQQLRNCKRDLRGRFAELACKYEMGDCFSRLGVSNFKFLEGRLYPRGNNLTTEIDLVAITPYRIYIVEAKSYFGTLTIQEDGGLVSSSGIKHNPVEQNQMHLDVIRCLLTDKIISNNPKLYSSLIFLYADSVVEKDNRSPTVKEKAYYTNAVTLFDTIKHLETKYSNITLNVDEIFQYLKSISKSPTAKNMSQHIAGIKRR